MKFPAKKAFALQFLVLFISCVATASAVPETLEDFATISFGHAKEKYLFIYRIESKGKDKLVFHLNRGDHLFSSEGSVAYPGGYKGFIGDLSAGFSERPVKSAGTHPGYQNPNFIIEMTININDGASCLTYRFRGHLEDFWNWNRSAKLQRAFDAISYKQPREYRL